MSSLLVHPYLSLFAFVFLSQLGLPLPADPVLLGAGALAARGQVGLLPSIAIAVLAMFLSDYVWYEGGRRRGARLLRLLCRISLEPDSCVRSSEDAFARNEVGAVVLGRFLPGVGGLAAPMAGLFHMNRGRFTFLTLGGALLKTVGVGGLGYLLSARLAQAMAFLARITGGLSVALGSLLFLYLVSKFVERERFIRSLRVLRIPPEELKRRLDAGEKLVIVDLRHSREVEEDPRTIPGALRMGPDELEARHLEIPRGREVVLVCT